MRKERMKEMLKEVTFSKKNMMRNSLVFHTALLLLALSREGMGSESNLDSNNDQDISKLMLRTKKSLMNEGSISVKQNERGIRMKRSSGTRLVADKSVEEQDILSNKMPRTKRSSPTGLVADKSVEEEVVGEEERSVVGCGEVVLDCPSSTMIVVMRGMMVVMVVMVVVMVV